MLQRLLRRTAMKPWPVLALMAALALQGPSVALAKAAQANAAPTPSPEDVAETAGAPLIGKYAPAFTLKTLDGKTIDLAKLYGKKPVYLKFWATWCVPCRLQMPHFENVERTLGKDIQVVAVDAGFNETIQAVRDYRRKMGLTMPIVVDDGRLADALNLRITPQHIVIGRDGKILHVGHLADAKLDNALRRAIAEKPAAYAPGAGATGAGVKGSGQSPPPLKTLAGQPLALHDGARATVMFFFSPWCETYLKSSRPAMAEACLKARQDVARLSAGSRARWVGVGAGLWASNKDLADYQRDHRLALTLALDETGGFFRAFEIADVPSLVVLDKAGRVVARTRRAAEASRLAERLSVKSPSSGKPSAKVS
jgi:thiol-disulfide isomerase/thioredoxin